MAPSTGNASQKMKKKPPPRIVPVVPLPFSRPNHSPRPITPEDTVQTEPKEGHQPPAPAPQVIEEQAASRVNGPLTPDSKASAPSPRQDQQATPESSSAELQHDVSEQQLDTKEQSSAIPAWTDESMHVPPPDPTRTTTNTTSGPDTTLNGTQIPLRPAEKHFAQPRISSGPCEASTQLPAHRPHPSVGSIVFGASAFSPSVSPTPQELESEMRMHQQHVTRPPPGFPAPHFGSPYFVPGHAHHPSNSNPPFPYPPMSLPPPPNGPFGYGREYPAGSWPHPQAHVPFQPPRFPSHPQAAFVNGSEHAHLSRSQSPTKSHTADTRAGSEYDHDIDGRIPFMPPFQPGTVPSKELAVEEMPVELVPFRLARYLSAQFGKSDFADFELQIRTGDNVYVHSLHVHGVIVSQSPVIASAIHATSPRTTGLPLIDIAATHKFVNAYPLVDALKHLYGAPFEVRDRTTMNKPYHEPYTPGTDAPNPYQDIMALALSYVAAGILLQLHGFIEHSIEFVRKYTRYDTMDQVLRFAFEEGHFDVLQSFGNTYQSVRALLLSVVFDFLASEIPPEFKLYTSAVEPPNASRQPNIVEAKGPKHNPRLSKIRFGDVPAEEDAKPDFVTQAISSVLINLPFPYLERLFTHPGLRKRLGWKVEDMMRAVVNEREQRRIKVLQSTSNPTSPTMLPDNLCWEERVDSSPDHPLGVVLTRRRVFD